MDFEKIRQEILVRIGAEVIMIQEPYVLSPVQIEHIQKFKIPVDCYQPRAPWITALDRESAMPTDLELRQLQSFCEYIVRSVYNERYVKKILEEMPLPKCGGHNTTIFRKGFRNRPELKIKDTNWFYRQFSWREGPLYIPHVLEKNYKGLSLVEVMDRSRSVLYERWARWKKDHKNIFPEPQG